MTNRVALILALAAVLFTAFNSYLAVRETELQQARARERQIFQLALDDVNGFEIYHGSDAKPAAVFRRDDKGFWNVTIPSRLITDTADVKTIEELQAIVKLASLRPVEDITSDAAGLNDPEKQTLRVVRSGDAIEETLIVGAVSPGGKLRYIARGDSPEAVHAVGADYLYVLDREPLEYRSMNLFDLHRGELTSVTLNPGGPDGEKNSVILRREPEGWFLTRPVRWPADEKRLSDLVQQLQTLRAQQVVADKVDDPGVFGLGHQAPRILLRVGNDTQEVRFGKYNHDSTGVHARRMSRNPVYVTSKTLARELAKAFRDPEWADSYRRRELQLLQDVQPAILYLQNPNGTSLVLTRQDDGKTWNASGTRNFDVFPEAVEAFVQTLRQIKAKSFISESQKNLTTYGLQPPLRRVICTDPANSQLAGINIGLVEKSNRAFFTIDGLPQVFEFYLPQAQVLLQDEIWFRTRQITNFDYKTIDTITIHNAHGTRKYRWVTGDHFQVIHPETAPLAKDELRFTGILNYLGRLPCRSYIEENAKDLGGFGLDQAKIRVIVTLRSNAGQDPSSEPALDLLIGNVVSGSAAQGRKPDYYARLAGSRTVFTVAGTLVEELGREFK